MENNKRSTVVISRYWDNPQILVHVSDQRIAIEVDLNDFLKALVMEMDHPALIVTRSQLADAILAATKQVLSKAKEASAAGV